MLDSPQAWTASSFSAGNLWMKIDLGVTMRVHGVVIQARHNNDQGYLADDQYVTEVEVQQSRDPNSGFSTLQSQANGVRFSPNSTFSNKQKSELKSMEPVVARYIKIVVWSWSGGYPSMRAGVLTSPGGVTSACRSCPEGKYNPDTGSNSAGACRSCPAGKFSAGATGAAACVLTPPSADTCYGAVVMIDLLNARYPFCVCM
jgi:hypothetical protein